MSNAREAAVEPALNPNPDDDRHTRDLRGRVALLTGASGLVGGNLAALLVERGAQVRATRRASSKVKHLDDLALTWVDADLEDRDKLAAAAAGVDVVFHCAAVPTQTRRLEGPHKKANVDGTRNIIDAVRSASAAAVAAGRAPPRLVHTSSVVTTAIAREGGPDVVESDPWNYAEHGLIESYAVTKREAEEMVLAATRGDDAIDAVVVNPGTMFGPRDAKPSTGRLLIELHAGHIVAVPSGCSSFVDVRDVARGMIAAWQSGARGERYILSGETLTWMEVFALMAAALGKKPPRLRIPDAFMHIGGFFGDLAEKITGKERDLNSAVTSYAVQRGYRFSSEKARRELGYRAGPVADAIRDEVAWLRAHGMLPAR